MEEQQAAPAQSSVTPKKFPRKKLIIGLIAFIIVFGGVGSVLAWRTAYLDNLLPVSVKEFFGRGEEVGEEEEEPVPPIISSVKASNITETGATITWTTDVEATSRVEYGTTTDYGSQTTEDSTLVVSHSVALTGLTKGTLYHYRVKSESAEGGLAISEDYTFTTEDPTKDWKTYRNEKYAFEIKYPTNASISESKFGTDGLYEKVRIIFIGASQTQKEYVTTDGYMVKVVVYESEQAKGSLDSLKEYDKNNCYPGLTCSDLTTTEISGLTAQTYSQTSSGQYVELPDRIDHYYIEKNERLYHIEVEYAGKESYNQISNLILSTFKFL